MGEAFTRHSLRPLLIEGTFFQTSLGHVVPREYEIMRRLAAHHIRCHSGASRSDEPGIHNHRPECEADLSTHRAKHVRL
jgi:hypothetical protein